MFAERLKELRKEKGITQIQFANDFHIANGTIGMWESGRREPDFETARRIADYFGTTVDYLLGRDEKKLIPEVEVVGMNIKELREQEGVSQKQLAEAVRLAQNTLSQFETGKREPDLSTTQRIADYFGVSVDYLLGRNDKKRPTPVTESGLSDRLQAPYMQEIHDTLLRLTPETRKLILAQIRAAEAFEDDAKK